MEEGRLGRAADLGVGEVAELDGELDVHRVVLHVLLREGDRLDGDEDGDRALGRHRHLLAVARDLPRLQSLRIDMWTATSLGVGYFARAMGARLLDLRVADDGITHNYITDGTLRVIAPEDPNRAFIHPGLGERPMHACSCSKAIAAFSEEPFMEKILKTTLKAYTSHTKTTREMLLVEFELIRDQGYADCDQEIDVGIASVAAPVTMGNIGAVFSVGAVGPIRRFDKDYRQKIGVDLKQLARKVSGAIKLCNVAEV